MLLGSITSETRLLLANALYFKGQWMHPFSHADTYPEPFFTDEGTSFHVHMMHASAQSFRGGVFEELNAKAIYMPYKVGNKKIKWPLLITVIL